MKNALLALGLLLFASVAHADQSWQDQLAQYKDKVSSESTGYVWGNYYLYAGATVVTCSADVAIVGATFVAETAPIVNGAVELISTYPQFDRVIKNLWTWNALANTTRGVVGGGGVAITDTLQFVYLWLGGDTTQAYGALENAYASTISETDALFAQQGQCVMSVAKAVIAAAELQKRGQPLPGDPGDIPAMSAPALP